MWIVGFCDRRSKKACCLVRRNSYSIVLGNIADRTTRFCILITESCQPTLDPCSDLTPFSWNEHACGLLVGATFATPGQPHEQWEILKWVQRSCKQLGEPCHRLDMERNLAALDRSLRDN